MLTEDETKAVLAAATSYDNRKAGRATILAWGEAARRARWTFAEALDAVHEHYANDTAFLMPGHVTQRIRVQRQDRSMRDLPPRPDELGQRRVEKLTSGAFGTVDGEVIEHQAAPTEPQPDRLARGCPHCLAGPGKPCTRPSRDGTPVALSRVHPSRTEAS